MQSSGPFCAVYIVDLFVHSSGPFGGPFSDGGGGGFFRAQRTPPGYGLGDILLPHVIVYQFLAILGTFQLL